MRGRASRVRRVENLRLEGCDKIWRQQSNGSPKSEQNVTDAVKPMRKSTSNGR